MQGVYDEVDAFFTNWSTAHNRFFEGPNSDLLSLIPFVLLCGLLYLVAREKLLAGKQPRAAA
jgi:hypothetical protein